jgi:hypothetical protein
MLHQTNLQPMNLHQMKVAMLVETIQVEEAVEQHHQDHQLLIHQRSILMIFLVALLVLLTTMMLC